MLATMEPRLFARFHLEAMRPGFLEPRYVTRFNSLRLAAVSSMEEVSLVLKGSWDQYTSSFSSFLHEDSGRKNILDILLAGGIVWASPTLGAAIACANFVSGRDTLTAVVTGFLAFVGFELLATVSLELVAVFAAFQLSKFTRDIWKNYRSRCGYT